MNNNIPKKALCIRNTSTWAHIKSEYKFVTSSPSGGII